MQSIVAVHTASIFLLFVQIHCLFEACSVAFVIGRDVSFGFCCFCLWFSAFVFSCVFCVFLVVPFIFLSALSSILWLFPFNSPRILLNSVQLFGRFDAFLQFYFCFLLCCYYFSIFSFQLDKWCSHFAKYFDQVLCRFNVLI